MVEMNWRWEVIDEDECVTRIRLSWQKTPVCLFVYPRELPKEGAEEYAAGFCAALTLALVTEQDLCVTMEVLFARNLAAGTNMVLV